MVPQVTNYDSIGESSQTPSLPHIGEGLVILLLSPARALGQGNCATLQYLAGFLECFLLHDKLLSW